MPVKQTRRLTNFTFTNDCAITSGLVTKNQYSDIKNVLKKNVVHKTYTTVYFDFKQCFLYTLQSKISSYIRHRLVAMCQNIINM